MSNSFGSDILIQARDPMKAPSFYVKELGFEIAHKTSNMISLHGKNTYLFIERGPALGPVLEVNVILTIETLGVFAVGRFGRAFTRLRSGETCA